MIPFLRRWSEWRLLRLWLGWQRSSAFLPRSGSEEGRRKGLRTRLHGPWQHRCYVRRSYIRGICCGCCRSCGRSEEHTSELQSRLHLVCRLLLEKKKNVISVVLIVV